MFFKSKEQPYDDHGLEQAIGQVFDIECRPSRQDQMRAETLANLDRLDGDLAEQQRIKAKAEEEIEDILAAKAAEHARLDALPASVQLAVAAE